MPGWMLGINPSDTITFLSHSTFSTGEEVFSCLWFYILQAKVSFLVQSSEQKKFSYSCLSSFGNHCDIKT